VASRPWLLPVATLVGGLISGLLVYIWAPEAEGHGTDAAVKAYHRLGGYVRARIPLIKSVASAITIGSGGSAGREGPTAQIAAGIGSIVASLLKLPEDERRYLVLVGMSAGLSAIFKSPLGTAIFGVEILYASMAFEGRALVFTIIGAAVSYAVTGMFDGWKPLFYLPGGGSFENAYELIWYLLLGLAAGVVGTLLPWVFYRIRDGFRALPIPNHVKPAVGGLALGLMGLYLPQLLGGGYGWIQLAIDGQLPLYLLLALAFGKILALSLTVSSGGSGGVFAPSLYVGAMLGAASATVVDKLTPFGPHNVSFAVVGMAALFAGAARVPVASLIMVAEMTGGYRLIMPTMLAVAVSYLLQSELTRNARYPSLYEAQVPHPVDSPVHHLAYYQAVAKMLRRRTVTLESDLVSEELGRWLAEGRPIPLMGGQEWLYAVEVRSDAPIVGQSLSTLALPASVLVIGILRDEDAVIPHGQTTIQAGDRLVLATTDRQMKVLAPLLEGVEEGADPRRSSARTSGFGSGSGGG
jgi:CIC family chloride channel protein